MMKCTMILSLGLLAAACNQQERSGAATGESPSKPTAAQAPADNTDRNERDRGGVTLTPGDQGGSDADRTLTQQVRRNVVDDGAVSSTGKNVKIVTVDGVVTLRGPVKSAEEKATIGAIAQRVSGVKRVDNQLETVTN